MNIQEVSVATITWARDSKEEELLRNALEKLAALHIPVFITDGGSPPSFLRFLHSFSHFTILPASTKGVWPQAKSSLTAAFNAGAPFIFYTEPDKKDFFHHSLHPVLSTAVTDEQSGIVMASRSAASFASFPPFQQMTETAINNCCAELTGKKIDYTYGPFLLNRKLVPHLGLMKEDTGWGWRPYALGIAHRLGYRLAAVKGDFFCPPDQQRDNSAERLYRMRQLGQNIQGIVLAATVILPE